jgi:hypothetical protein
VKCVSATIAIGAHNSSPLGFGDISRRFLQDAQNSLLGFAHLGHRLRSTSPHSFAHLMQFCDGPTLAQLEARIQ